MTDTILFAGFAVAYAVLLGLGIGLVVRAGRLTPADLPLVIIAGLIYDNTVITLGRFIGAGALLEGLNLARFWIHAFVTPVLVIFAWYAVARARVGWARTRIAPVLAILVTVALVVLEIVTVLAGLSIAPGWNYGVLSYSSTAGGGPPAMVLFVAAALIIAGGVVWRRTGWPWLLIGAIVMTLGSGIPVPVNSGAVTNAFELVLLISILATKWHQDRSTRP